MALSSEPPLARPFFFSASISDAAIVGLALVAWALSAHGAGSAAQQAPAAIWATLAVLAGAVGYLLGRRAAPTVVIDPALAAELLAAWNAKRR